MPSSLSSLALVALLSPACWSGFAEVHVAGSDASAPGDRPATDRPLVDAQGAPDGARDATADTGGPDGIGLDVVDVVVPEDRLAVDAVDVPAPDDARDAGMGLDVVAAEDRVEVSAGDVVDVPAPCGGACAAGEECVGGRCGRWTFVSFVTISGSLYEGFADGLERLDRDLDTISSTWIGRTCRASELGEHAREVCGGFPAVLGDRDRVTFRADRSVYVPGCVQCDDGGVPRVDDGSACRSFWNRAAVCAFNPR